MLHVGVTLVCVIAVTSAYGVAQRLLGHPVSWAIELNELLQVALAFLPLAYVQNMGKHVSMELLQSMMGHAGRRAVRAIYSTVGGALATALAYSTGTVAMSSFAMDERTVVAELPIYPFKICVTIGFVLLAAQFFAHVWECVRNAPECVADPASSESYL